MVPFQYANRNVIKSKAPTNNIQSIGEFVAWTTSSCEMIGMIVLIIFCGITFWVHYRIVHRNYFKQIENFDTLGCSLPIIGHLHYILGKSPDGRILTKFIAKLKF